MWPSLVRRLFWEQEIAGSNPAIPIESVNHTSLLGGWPSQIHGEYPHWHEGYLEKDKSARTLKSSILLFSALDDSATLNSYFLLEAKKSSSFG